MHRPEGIFLDHVTLWTRDLVASRNAWEEQGFLVSAEKDFGDWVGCFVFFSDGFYHELLQFKDTPEKPDWVCDWELFLQDFGGDYDSLTVCAPGIEGFSAPLKDYYVSPISGVHLESYRNDDSGWLTFDFEDETDFLNRSKGKYGLNLGVLEYVHKGKPWIRSCSYDFESFWSANEPETYAICRHPNEIQTVKQAKISIPPGLRDAWEQFLIAGGCAKERGVFVDGMGRDIVLAADSSLRVAKMSFDYA